MDNANGYPQQNNDASDFEKDFLQNVGQPGAQPNASMQSNTNVKSGIQRSGAGKPKSGFRLTIIVAAIAVAALIGIVAVLIVRNLTSEKIPPITDDEMDGSVSEGSWILRDENDNPIAVRATCSLEEDSYVFMKDNSYIHTNGDTTIEEGEYTIGNGLMRLVGNNGAVFEIDYNFGDIVVNGGNYSCEGFNDA